MWGKQPYPEGIHVTMCGGGGGAIARHSAIRDAQATLAREQAHVDIDLPVDQPAACSQTGARLDVSITMPCDKIVFAVVPSNRRDQRPGSEPGSQAAPP